jgi:hypothetical protein
MLSGLLATAPVRNASGGVRDKEIDRGSVAQPKMQICFDRCLRQEVRRYARSARVQEDVVDDMHDRVVTRPSSWSVTLY